MQGRQIGERDGLRLTVIDDAKSIDVAALSTLAEGAWAADYAGQPRADIREPYLRRLMQGGDWFVVAAIDGSGLPLGFELAFARTLHVGERTLAAYYVSAFTVSEHHRRRGIGRFVLEGINQQVFDVRGADVIFSTFHIGHAGSPTVQATYDAAGFEVRRFSEGAMQVLRFGELPFAGPALEQAAVGALRLAGDGRTLVAAPGLTAAPVSIAELDAAVARRHRVRFALGDGFAAHYLSDVAGDAEGNLWLEFEGGATCWLTYCVNPLAYDAIDIGTIGMLQTALFEGCSARQIMMAVAELARRLQAMGCRGLLVMDHHGLPATLAAEFGLATSDRACFAVRGPREHTASLEPGPGPYFLDFL